MMVDHFEVHQVSTNQQLAEVARGWLDKELIALDTEFMRVRTFYPAAALFQVCDAEAVYLIDPVAVTDLEPLADVLRCSSVIKLMHSCSEDLEVCDRHLGALPDPLFDTQIAGAFCGLGLSMGYQRMLDDVLGLTLEKSETRTDWLQDLCPMRNCDTRQRTLHIFPDSIANCVRVWSSLAPTLGYKKNAQLC